MARVLDVLQRLRDHARTAAEADLRRAESERDRQLARVELIRTAIADARESCDATDVTTLDTYFAFRLQGEVASRREEMRLHQRERDVDAYGRRHVQTVRDQLAVEHLIEARAEAAAHHESAKDAARMDEIGARLQRVT